MDGSGVSDIESGVAALGDGESDPFPLEFDAPRRSVDPEALCDLRGFLGRELLLVVYSIDRVARP